ncbi:class II aldolase/adducin family protein [Acinetobacter indicus]|uniref:class II aldolase/adducin family protein n=1 Tax=Acinetobacter indicus TaxID=756892 RepID=UPI000CEC9573|nr:class II aldolase/adducin family protein [Acinetobacter indicus]
MTIKNLVTAAEWQARCELAALYRIIAHYKMTDLIDTHISLRLPDQPDCFLINQYGVAFEKMQASTLVKINHAGAVVESYEQEKPVNMAGFVIHSAIHAAHPHLNCVIHTHTADGIAVSAQKHGLLPISQHALKFYQYLAYHEYEGVALSTDEQERLIADLAGHRAMILRNHGLLVAGESIARAFHEIYFLERACQAQIKALSGGAELHYPSEEVCVQTAKQFASPLVEPILQRAWLAALSLIEHQQAEYSA